MFKTLDFARVKWMSKMVGKFCHPKKLVTNFAYQNPKFYKRYLANFAAQKQLVKSLSTQNLVENKLWTAVQPWFSRKIIKLEGLTSEVW
jgi:hypothetical protein